MFSNPINQLMTPEARLELWQRDRCYWARIARGRSIGYRRGKKYGSWYARVILKSRKQRRVRIGQANDYVAADGTTILTFAQALVSAENWCDSQGVEVIDRDLPWEVEPEYPEVLASPPNPYTVSHAVIQYLEWLREYRASFTSEYYNARAHVFPTIGHRPVAELTPQELQHWLFKVANAPPRLRSRRDAHQQYVATSRDPEFIRRRKQSANRIFGMLHAALNQAYEQLKVEDDTAWRRVRTFKGVSRAKVRFLEQDECVRLIQVSRPDFGLFASGALLTGCRFGELTRMNVEDVDLGRRRVEVQDSKNGEQRYVLFSEEAMEFFAAQIDGRRPKAPLFIHKSKRRWRKGQQWSPLVDACNQAGITPPIRFHELRHTFASHAVMAGIPLKVVADQLGHMDTRTVDRYYSRLGNSYVKEVMAEKMPRLLYPDQPVLAAE